jgi:CheY-like chemotaxis protein/HPt (histidine-containing phosphotransfer) domain-containing protein
MINNESDILLVVDDSDITRQLIKDIFKNTSLKIVTCNDGLEGIKKALEYKPGLILLDLMMPDFDGIKMLKVIKLLDDVKNIPVVVISANTNKRNVLAATEAGADKIIPKPFDKNIIVDCVKQYIDFKLVESGVNDSENTVSKSDVDEIKSKLENYFLETFPKKKAMIIRGIESCNIDRIKNIVHEIRGTGSVIGLPELTQISGEIEDKLDDRAVDWSEIEEMSNKLFTIINTLQR